MTRLTGEINGLNHPSPSHRQQAEDKLREYLDSIDPYLENRETRYILRKLESNDTPGARRLVGYYYGLREQKIKYEEGFISLFKEHHIEEKEFYEAKSFYLAIKNFFPRVRMINDCCAGNGMVGFIWSLHHPETRIKWIDIQENKNHRLINSRFREMEKETREETGEVKREYYLMDLKSQPLPISDLNVSIHSCNDLADRIIEQSVAHRVAFAVMPCCHSHSPYLPREVLEYFDNKTDAIDLMRLRYALENNYEIKVRNINPQITAKNRIIIGLPN